MSRRISQVSSAVTTPQPSPTPEPTGATEVFAAIERAVGGIVLAEPLTVRLAVGCLAAGGHLLVEDHPGLGKTTLAKSLAGAVGLGFRRLQCTSDLLPADVTGATILGPDGSEPTFRPGPVFTNLLMADELNRASPRAQSALLEAMEERQVTVDGTTYPLPRPFFVLATQNPYDAAGTSPLPHGQRDRFLVRVSIGRPSRGQMDDLLAGADPAELDLLEAVDTHPSVAVGPSPRAARSLVAAASALAVAAGRTYLSPAEVQDAAAPVLAHRLALHPAAEITEQGAEVLVAGIAQSLPVPLRGDPEGR
jgi:MoxR-like ATPase